MGASASALRAHEELFAYWAGLRRSGQLPCRGDINPAGFKKLLPTISLIDVPASRPDYRIRLAGTGLYGVYGGETTGKKLDDIYNSTAAEYWRSELNQVVAERRPRAGYHSLAWRGAAHMTLLWLRLPLASNGSEVDMILGYDTVLGLQREFGSGIRAA